MTEPIPAPPVPQVGIQTPKMPTQESVAFTFLGLICLFAAGYFFGSGSPGLGVLMLMLMFVCLYLMSKTMVDRR